MRENKRTPLKRMNRWIRKNLFASSFDVFLTLICLAFICWALPPFLKWSVFDADFAGTTRDDCTSGGACWVFVKMRFNQFIYGLYPEHLYWRPNLVFVISGLWLAALIFPEWKGKRKLAFTGVLLGPIIVYQILYDGFGYLEIVDTPQWGGLLLTMIIAGVGIACSLPLGIILALGRQSELILVRKFSIVFIELWRGVPLITVLFMASVMLPLFFEEGTHFDKLMRCLIGVTLFASAYMAEVVRGGLQAVPKTQIEAAQALGMGYWQSMGFVVLPQAIRIVIPGIVNTFIGLFKDTSLVVVIGMFDLLGMVKAAFTNREWAGYSVEGYLFAGLLFWVFCYWMSKFSQKIENKINMDKHSSGSKAWNLS